MYSLTEIDMNVDEKIIKMCFKSLASLAHTLTATCPCPCVPSLQHKIALNGQKAEHFFKGRTQLCLTFQSV